jgi:uncharacterized protein (TIGR02145 family)
MSAFLCNQLFSSCINNIPEEMPQAGDVPISLNASFRDMSRAVTGESDEEIGLYITIQPSTIDKTRYVDNMKFSYNQSSNCFLPEETIFFPEGNSSICDFISYHPYKKDAIKKGESTMEVEAQTDQSDKTALDASDFMVATTIGVAASEDSVKLDFHHKLSLLNIRLKPISGYTTEMLLASNPTIKIKDVYTRATYDLKSDKFTGLNTKADIIPHGNWELKDDTLCGKTAILIPQILRQSHVIFELLIDGKLFECEMGTEYKLESGVAENNTINLQFSSDAIESSITTSVTDWSTRDKEWTGNQIGTVIWTDKLNFNTSNVIKVMNKETQIAEICLEYLCTNEIQKQAVVIYPMANGKADLAKGLVIELKGETDEKHGGSVAWNASTNSLTYTAGTSPVIPCIYITEKGEIKTIRPVDALQIQLRPDLLVGGDKTIEYPIVKIGTQYWTRANYKSLKYTDGTDIAYGGGADLKGNSVTVNNDTPQYYQCVNAYFYYNAACVATGNLTPDGWRVGNETDYNRLKTYVKDNAGVLKHNEGTWEKNSNPITNLAGFNGTGIGYFNKTYGNNSKANGYWCAKDNEPTKVDKIFTLSSSDNKITIKNATIADMALLTRFVRN